jgi:hypothetical protein
MVSESSEETTEKKELKMQSPKRLSNAEIIRKLTKLQQEVKEERKARAIPANVIDRENGFQLDGILAMLERTAHTFATFVNLPKVL